MRAVWRRGVILRTLVILSVLGNLVGFAGAGWMLERKGGWQYLKMKFCGPRVTLTPAQVARCRLFALLPHNPTDVYFVGDSIIAAAEVAELFGPCARNRGIIGDTTSGVLARLDEIVVGRPRDIHLMIGINDLQGGLPVAEIADRYRRIVEEITTASPATRLHLQSVLPVNPSQYQRVIVPNYPHITMPTREKVTQLNEHLRQLAACGAGVDYVDLSALNDDQGWLRPEYTDDGLHLNGPGIVAWAQAVRSALEPRLSQGQ